MGILLPSSFSLDVLLNSREGLNQWYSHAGLAPPAPLWVQPRKQEDGEACVTYKKVVVGGQAPGVFSWASVLMICLLSQQALA